MNHLEIYHLETAVSAEETQWLNWLKSVEKHVGHSLDGDQYKDGYSLDYAHDCFKAGVTPLNYVISYYKK